MAEESDFSSVLLAADNHNIGNVQLSWLDPDSWRLKFGNAGKMMATSVLSGVDSFYNTGIQVANWFGANAQQRDTEQWITSIDSDLGLYYTDNKDAADIAGFVLGAFVPGLGGIKLFNAGQRALKIAANEGKLGSNLSKATGLLIPKTDQYVDAAIKQMRESTTTMKLINANTIRAFGAGIHQNVLEAAAFEVAVQATMFKSPILDEQDTYDIAKNLVIGGLVGGVVGGAFSAASTIGKVKAAQRIENVARLPFTGRIAFSEAATPDQRIILLAEDSDAAAIPLVITTPKGEVINNNFAVNKNLYDDKLRKNSNDIRSNIHNLTANDPLLANIVANSSVGLGHQQMFANFIGTKEISRINELSKAERALARELKQGPVKPNFATRYVKLIGEDLGQVTDAAPLYKTLGDLYPGKEAVISAVKRYKFDAKTEWNPLETIKKSPTAYLQGEARFIWAQDILKEIKPGTVINEFDIPLLQRAYTDKNLNIKVSIAGGLEYQVPASLDELYGLIKEKQMELATELMRTKTAFKSNTDAVSAVTNLRKSYIEGTQSSSEFSDVFAMQSAHRDYIDSLKAKNLSTTNAAEAIDPKYLPKWAKFTYDLESANVGDGNILDAMVYLKETQKLYQEEGRRVASKVLSQTNVNLFPDIPDSALLSSSGTGSGPGLISFENSNYGTIGSHMAFIGSQSREAKAAMKRVTNERLDSSITRLASKPEAAIEFESINQKITRSPEHWVYDDEVDALITKKAVREFSEAENLTTRYDETQVFGQLKIANYDDIPEDQIIFIKNAETSDFIKQHIQRTGQRTNDFRDIRSAQGHTDVKDPNVFRPIRPNLRDFPHFAFVVDEKVTGTGHMTMLHAATEKELGQLIDRVPKDRYKVITKAESEEYKRARGEYEYSRSLHENYIDTSLKKDGVFSNFFPKADPKRIVDDILQQHYRDDEVLVYEAVRLMYEPQFNFLEDLGKSYSKIATSQFGRSISSLEKITDNPYFNYIKTALDISKVAEYPILYSFNKTLDSAFSRGWAVIRDTFDGAKSSVDLDAVNAALDKYGMKPASMGAYDAGMYDLMNHTAPRGDLTRFVKSMNAVLSRFVLGLDPLNALNNAIGSNILRTTELKSILRAIEAGDTNTAGELSKLAKVVVPGTTDEIFSTPKLISRAIQNYWGPNKALYIAKYKEAGYIKDLTEQFHLMVEDFTLKGTETAAELSRRTNSAFEKAKEITRKGETLTGNTFAEEFNRFITANVMDQITGVAVRNGIMTQKEALSYINTFVNRVEGNVIATQRPLIFQGPIGQAIGLFQSYQFNLLQQLFRYVGEGSKKDIAMLLGLQSTLYGAQSLPAFQFFNQHIVGTLSGNKEHRDLYDAAYGIVGRQAGDFLLYGLPSNLLQANIYSRGDINPRQVTVIPTNPADIPILSAWTRFFGSMRETITKSTNGGDIWQAFLQGIEHNGISRPLAGLAQTLQATGPEGKAFSTSSKGSILGSNDLMHVSTLIRLAGGRPIDEAITNDAMFRVKSYEAKRRADMLELAERVKTSLIQGREPDEEAVNAFATRYVELGGKQANFNKWMMDLYKNANISQAEQLRSKLNHPYAYKMQLLMGGEE